MKTFEVKVYDNILLMKRTIVVEAESSEYAEKLVQDMSSTYRVLYIEEVNIDSKDRSCL